MICFVVIALIGILLLLLLLQFSAHYSRYGKLINVIPGPRPLPLFGNVLQFNTRSDKLYDVLRILAWNYGSVVRVWYLTTAFVGIRHPDDLEVILSSQKTIQKSYIYNYLEPWLRTGLLTSTGVKWRSRRKILTPAFHFQVLKKYMEITGEQTDKIIEKLRKEGSESNQELLQLCSTITLNIICESTMGVALNKMDETFVRKYKTAIHEMGEVIVRRTVKPYISDWMLPLTDLGRMQKRALKVLHTFTDKVLNDRREYHEVTGNEYLTEFDVEDSENISIRYSGQKKRLAMLDLLLLAEQKGLIDEEGIKEEMDTFIFEGHDTTGIGLVFILMLLAENKEAQDRARKEVQNVMSKYEGKLDQLALQDLAYTERCIKEALRLYPSVPMILRHLTEDIKIKNYTLPAEIDVTCFLLDLHRDPEFWPEPEKFDPDRFLPEPSAKRHPFAYLPFSAGPRNCIGQKFAINELKSVVARILYNFFLEPVDRTSDVKFATELVLRPTHPVYIKFVRIDSL